MKHKQNHKFKSCEAHSSQENYAQNTRKTSQSKRTYLRLTMQLALLLLLSFLLVGKSMAANHIIEMTAVQTDNDDGLGNKMLAYKMLSHEIDDFSINVLSRYGEQATIPGPTIVITEGDTVTISFSNDIPGTNAAPTEQGVISNQVSIHVHGVHYDIDSDGTLEIINQVTDEGAGYGPGHVHPAGNVTEYSYTWTAAPGTAGTWAYHDHNFMTHNGAEQRGLFGALIVNPVGAPVYDKEYVLYLTDDAFWGLEMDAAGNQTKHGVSPDLTAESGNDVRFHLISLGTDIHTFTLDGYQWDDPGTTNLINKVAIGPLEKHVFAVTATHSAKYRDKSFTNNLMGVRGLFNVQ